MKSRKDTTIVLGSLRYKTSVDSDLLLNANLEQTQKEILETDRNSAINLNQIYDDERQQSSNFRFTFNIKYIYENNLIGVIQKEINGGYGPFLNNLYYVNNTYTSAFYSGYPQSNEFDLIRNDVNNTHINFITKSATTYNWNYFISYGYENNYNAELHYADATNTIDWISGDGIPVFISNSQINGTNVIQFRSFVKHGLKEFEYVKLAGFADENQFMFPSVTAGTNVYEIYSIGNGEFNTEEYVFNIVDIGYPVSFFVGGGLIKRVLDPNNVSETTSRYYVRKNKLLTNIDDLTLTNNGYQQSSFKDEKKYEFSAITPNLVSRISVKNSNKTYNITNANDLNISGLTDNNGNPISEVFLTFIHKGYMGWFNYPNQDPTSLSPITSPSLKNGWGFNITNNQLNDWWNGDNTRSDSDITTRSYEINGFRFFYNETLRKGRVLDGDFCEYNQFEQKERTISLNYHKLKFNNSLFSVSDSNITNPGYYYQVYFPAPIRAYSTYIETSRQNEADYYPTPLNYSGYTAVDIPSYSFYSSFNQQWRWRDIYTYGYIDNEGVGVDFPYLNKSHYPYTSVFFRLIPDDANYLEEVNIVTQPLIDECE